MDDQRIIGFDPGLERTGYGVLQVDGARPRLIEAGLIRIPRDLPLSERLSHLYRGAREVIDEYKPIAIAVEELFSHYERPATAVLMGHARGVLLLAIAQSGISSHGYLPTRVKKLMTGSGRATKEQVQRAVQAEFRLAQLPDPPDVADAIAIALCHFHARQVGAA